MQWPQYFAAARRPLLVYKKKIYDTSAVKKYCSCLTAAIVACPGGALQAALETVIHERQGCIAKKHGGDLGGRAGRDLAPAEACRGRTSRALARAQEPRGGVQAEGLPGAYDHYNQADGLEYLARTGADATERDVVRAPANRRRASSGAATRPARRGTRRSARAASRRGPRPVGWGGPSRRQARRRPGVRRGAREPDNAEFVRGRERRRAREEAAAAGRRARGATIRLLGPTSSTTATATAAAAAGAARRGPARPSSDGRGDARPHAAEAAGPDRPAGAGDIYYVQTTRLPQATRPAELEARPPSRPSSPTSSASALAAPRRPARTHEPQ